MVQTTIGFQLPDVISKAESLPSPPGVALEILRLTNDEGVGLDDLSATISQDPALAAKLLKLANSSMSRRGGEVTTLERAAMMLGLKTVKLMALSFSLANGMSKNEGSRFPLDQYWQNSLTAAVAGRSLAQLIKTGYAEEAFLCGLLLRIGQLTMAECLPERYEEVLDHSASALPTAFEERMILGFDYHDVGSGLLHSWDMPALIVRGIAFSDESCDLPDDLDEEERVFVHLMTMTDLATSVLCDSRKGEAMQKLHELASRYGGVETDSIDAFLIGLQAGVGEAASLMNVDLRNFQSYEDIVEQARMQMVNISLGTALDLQQTTDRADQLEQQNRDLQRLATTDKLTGLNNRAAFDSHLHDTVESKLAPGTSGEVGVLIMDIDHFKKFNDTYGHAVGDEVLRLVGSRLKSVIRGTDDFVARYGGEEFVVVIGEGSETALAKIAERIRGAVAEGELEHEGQRLSVTISIGGASGPVSRQAHGEELIKRADANLYEAKQAGRNRAICRRVELS